tara:strand:- start:710 stop:2908 length:2199 start_codon:yes stop_codon:yes gene_type:complete
MFKLLIRIFLVLIILIALFIIYLGVFGIKTNKFNELIKSQISNVDNRLDIDLQDVFFKINFKERSFSLNGKNVKLFVLKENQEFANVDLLIDFRSIFNQDNKIKKIIINSKENEINKLLKFIKTYKINIPVLYLENSVTKGRIVYDIIVESKDKILDEIEIFGEIRDTNLNILGKQRIENINLNFNFKNQDLEINNLKLNYKNVNFTSKNIKVETKNNLINIKGDFKNKIDQKLASNFFDYELKNYLNEKTALSSKSNFDITLSRKFKLKNYKLDTKIDVENLNINLKILDLNNYIKNFDNRIILKSGELNLSIHNSNNTKVKFKSKYILGEGKKFKNISLDYSKSKLIEKYNFYIDLSENELKIDEINFNKKLNEELFLKLNLIKNRNIYEVRNLKLFNDKNLFNLNNVKITENFKITDFNSVDFKYINKDEFKNEVLIKKNKKNIKLTSKNLDISTNLEKSLKSKSKKNFLDIFENLNSSLDIEVTSVRLDKEHVLKNLKGKVSIINNKIDKAKLSAKFSEGKKFIYNKDDLNGKKVTTIYSDVAKPFVKKFKFIKGFEDGKLDYTSTEIKKNLSNSELRIYDFKLQDMPALTKLLSLASLQGIADLATGEGIRFNEFDMFFENSKDLIKINEIYALGPAISILMEGYVEKNNLVSLRGTLVPATTINKTIAKIPLLGNLLVGEKMGEGVFGVSFKIKGPPNKLKTIVNPIKTLTPRFITRTLDKIKKSN